MLLTIHPPSSVEIKNEWSYTFTLLICVDGVDKENYLYVVGGGDLWCSARAPAFADVWREGNTVMQRFIY
jgi:hypothetical protein